MIKKYLCIDYDVTELGTGTPLGSGTDLCTCRQADCASYVGNWSCQIPSSYPDAAIDWQIIGYPNATCGGNADLNRPSGSINTGPNAVSLASFDIDNEGNGLISYLLAPIIALIVLVPAIVLVLKNRSESS